MKKDDIEGIIVSPMSTVEFCSDQKFIDLLTDNEIKLFMMPEEFEWDGVSPLEHGNMLHQVDVEELLPRKQIMIDNDTIAQADFKVQSQKACFDRPSRNSSARHKAYDGRKMAKRGMSYDCDEYLLSEEHGTDFRKIPS